MRRIMVALVAIAILAPSAAAAQEAGPDRSIDVVYSLEGASDAPPIAAAFEDRPDYSYTPCVYVTDSVFRLYAAYIGRNLDEAGFVFWLESYAKGERNLVQISDYFAQSAESSGCTEASTTTTLSA